MAEAIFQTLAKAKRLSTEIFTLNEMGVEVLVSGSPAYTPRFGQVLLRAQENDSTTPGSKDFKNFALRFPGVADPKDIDGVSMRVAAFNDDVQLALAIPDSETFKRTVYSSKVLSGLFLGFAPNAGETMAEAMRLALAEVVTFVTDNEDIWGSTDSRDPVKHGAKCAILAAGSGEITVDLFTKEFIQKIVDKANEMANEYGKDDKGKRRLSPKKAAAPAPKSTLSDEDK